MRVVTTFLSLRVRTIAFIRRQSGYVNQYQLNVKDFRDGQIMSYFDNKDHFETTLSLFFDKVEVATITESWPKNTYEFYVAKCIK